MSTIERVTDLVAPLLESMDLELYDVELNGGTLRVTVTGESGLDLDALADLTRRLSRELDEHDPMPGRYTLEVSSPGLERRLRTRQHFAGAIGETVNVKLAPHIEGDRRRRGQLVSVDEAGITIAVDDDTLEIAFGDVTKATTVFEWGPAPKPGSPESRQKRKSPRPDREAPAR